MAAPARPDVPGPDSGAPTVTRLDIFAAFLKIGLMGFGGVAPYARRVIVEERRWFSEEDYAAILGFGQVLPGANTVNAAVIIGDRFQGALGSLLALLGLLTMPMAALVALAAVYDRFAGVADVQRGLNGVAAGAAGLVVGAGVKMAVRVRPDALALALGASAMVAVLVLKLPLMVAVLVLAPAGILLSLARRRG